MNNQTDAGNINPDSGEMPWIAATFAALAAYFVSIGIARFAYSPLIPALIKEEWFTASDATYLGAANLAGYLIGAISGKWVGNRIAHHLLLGLVMLIVSASLFASMFPISFTWYFVWRFVSGYCGGIVMVLAATLILPRVPSHRLGLASGLMFTGVGGGIALSGLLVPLLVEIGLTETWIILGTISLVLTAIVYPFWPRDAQSQSVKSTDQTAKISHAFTFPLNSLYVSYGLVAMALTAHMVFLVDYVARDLNLGLGVGGKIWIAFGLGAMVGPLSVGALAGWIGFRYALHVLLLIMFISIGMVLVDHSLPALYVSAFAVGATVPGVVPLIAGTIHELTKSDSSLNKTAWSLSTVAFAVGQAIAAYVYAAMYAAFLEYIPVFQLAAAIALLALIINLLSSHWQNQQSP